MSNRKIEPGCMAVIRKGPHSGKEVFVIEKAVPPVHKMPNGVLTECNTISWIVELSFEKKVEYTDGETRMVTMGAADEPYLLRIDGYDPDADEVYEEEQLWISF